MANLKFSKSRHTVDMLPQNKKLVKFSKPYKKDLLKMVRAAVKNLEEFAK